jgi:hypothetical protein
MKKVFLIVLLIFSFSFISAFSNPTNYDYKEKITQTEYYPHDNVVVSVTRYVDYENDDRYSTYDYRHGYSYRTTEDYWNDRYEDEMHDYGSYRLRNYDRQREYYDDYERDYYNDEPKHYSRHNSHYRDYGDVECYDYPPRGKLFYIRC